MVRPFFAGLRPNHHPPDQTLVILHSLAVCVEQLCARSADAPFLKALRPQYCVFCGQAARSAEGVLQLVGHGMYSRQVRGLVETDWTGRGASIFVLTSTGTFPACPEV